MNNFITNSDAKDLKDRLVQLIQNSEQLKFLVGFFYFSGIQELYEGLKDVEDREIRVLVGLNVDTSIYGIIEHAGQAGAQSDEETTHKFLESVKKSLNTDIFDNKQFYEQARFFVDLIRKDKLKIRKTYNPNHAKLYIFNLDQSQVGRSNLFITGSSNLTRAGLVTQEEFNVEISDYGFEDAEKYFDELWGEAVHITEFEEAKKKLIEIIENETLIKELSPFEAFALVLKVYLDSFEEHHVSQSLPELLRKHGYTPYRYQLDAVKQALAIIDKSNGVIIADVVGLGKSIIACAIARELKKRGIVICPPGLIGDRNKKSGWKKYLEEFGLHDWEARSKGDLLSVTEFVKAHDDIEVVIIDEVHRFRNQDTKEYELLKNICRNKIVIMLTATPFNNRPGDILSLLKLFITPKQSSITLDNNLVEKFKAFKGTFDRLAYIKKHYNSSSSAKRKKAKNYYQTLFGDLPIDLNKVADRSRYLAKQIRDVIEPVTIRRNRLDLQNNPLYKDEVRALSKIADPEEWYYELTKEQSLFYDTVIKDYFGDPDEGGQFKGAIYRPFEYEKQRDDISVENLSKEENRQFIQQRNLYDFMRRLLVKRFESSFGSFEQSIKNFKKITKLSLEFIENTGKYILDRTLLTKIYDLDGDEIEQYLEEYATKISKGEKPKNHKIYKVKDFQYVKEFLEHIQSDLQLFDEILAKLSNLKLVKSDPKTDCLISNLEREKSKKPPKGEANKKYVIFSEYLDTVSYIGPILSKRFKDRVLIVGRDLGQKKIEQINRNFDASYPEQDNEFDILIATDKLSEGFNLNRAGMVINYDIPWNPVRVIQRVGRINRISKKVFSELNIVNFFPSERGAQLVKSREIASNKMFLIHNTLGEDSKIFDINEEPTASGLFTRVQQNPDKQEEESFYTKALSEYMKIEKDYPEVINSIEKAPGRVKVGKSFSENELLVFHRKGRLYVHCLKYDDENNVPFQSTFEEVFDQVICSPEVNSNHLSERFWDSYEEVKNFREHRSGAISEMSLEQKALNNLTTLINKIHDENIVAQKDFLRMLKEDVLDYGTLSDYTLRRMANMNTSSAAGLKKTSEEIKSLRNELGEDYLQKEKTNLKTLPKEIIIAIENQKS